MNRIKLTFDEYANIKYKELNGIYETECGNFYWLNGQAHRIDGPACDAVSGYKAWYVNSKHHRLDGPAVEYTDGRKEWWIDDVEYSEEEYYLITNGLTNYE
jgi:hypothetical protein